MTTEEFRDISRTLAEGRRIRELLRHEMESKGLGESLAEGVNTVESLRGRHEASESRVSPIFSDADKSFWWETLTLLGVVGAILMWTCVFIPLLFG